jgi:hypothetical protein
MDGPCRSIIDDGVRETVEGRAERSPFRRVVELHKLVLAGLLRLLVPSEL